MTMTDGPIVITPDWPAPDGVLAFTTTRDGGVSQAEFASLNVGARSGDVDSAITQNRAVVTRMLPPDRPPLWLNQVHGVRVHESGSLPGGEPAADASICRNAPYACAVLTADCLPVLLCSEDSLDVAAAHAGWRGLHQGVIEATVQALNLPSAGLMAWLGPAISQEAFEVGPEVRRAFVSQNPALARAFQQGTGDRWHADLYGIARMVLERLGVTRIYGGHWCTYQDPSLYSYRRDGQTGRMVSVITRVE